MDSLRYTPKSHGKLLYNRVCKEDKYLLNGMDNVICHNDSMKKVIDYIRQHKIRAFFCCIALLLVLFLFIRLFFPLLVNPIYSLGDDLAEYKRTFCIFWTEKKPYAVYPEKRDVRAAESYEYHLYHEFFPLFFFLFDDDILATLECKYTEDAFDAEFRRLTELCGDPDETYFSYPAFLYASDGRAFMEYVLVDRDNLTMRYFSVQNMSYAKKYVDPKYLPLSWSTQSIR